MKPTAFLKKLIIILFTLCLFIFNPSQALAATMSLSPASNNLVKGRTYNLSVYINTEGANIVSVDARISYEPSKVSILSVTQGDIFTSPLLNDYANGLVRLSAGSLGSSVFNGIHGLLGTIRFTAIETGSTNFTITSSSLIVDSTTNDRLSGTTNATYLIGLTDNNGHLPPTGLFDNWGNVSIVAGTVIILAGFDMIYQVRQNNKKKNYA
jgi:hypothetical protein